MKPITDDEIIDAANILTTAAHQRLNKTSVDFVEDSPCTKTCDLVSEVFALLIAPSSESPAEPSSKPGP